MILYVIDCHWSGNSEKSETWRPKKTDVRLCPAHKEEQHAPKHASETFSCLSFCLFCIVWSHSGWWKSLISHSWGSSQLTGLAWLAEVKFFFSSSKSVQQWSLCLWCFRFSVGTVSQSQRLQGVTVGWAFLGLLAEETLWTPQRSFYDYFPYQTWYIFSLLYWLCSYRCCWWTCFCCWLIVIVPG